METQVSIAAAYQAVRSQLGQVIQGQHQVIEQLFITLLCKGHALLEGVPGTAKTLMVRALAHLVSASFRRIQFTPDLMPSDIVGTNVFDISKSTFTLRRGPIFCDVLLADEINRTPAKTQAALLEAMQERQVTIDGESVSLGDLFTVFATQNPIEYEGTYRLPEAQLDRFLMKIEVKYPTAEEEETVLAAYHAGREPHDLRGYTLTPVLHPDLLRKLRRDVVDIRVEPDLIRYVRQITWATRTHEAILLGCGPRASIHLLHAAKALAHIRQRDFVTPDDVKEMSSPVMRHRIILRPESEVEGMAADDALRQILDSVKVPR